MAENKKSFIAYADWIDSFEELEDDEAGRLAKHLWRYVNDLNPVTDDRIVKVSFIPIKASLKRDLNKWDNKREKRAEAGRLGGLAKASNAKQKLANLAVSDSVNVNVSVSDSVNENKDIYISKIQEKFYQSLIKFVDEFDKEDIRRFYEYWSEPNKSMTKIKWQLEKTWDTKRRLNRWTKNKFNEKTRTNNQRGFKSDSSQQAAESIVRSLYD